ncbi:MAG TPA: DUF4147 domain-containing protein [Longimicrobiales bacterium]|nr:DUF4147 domain-containing protein [Longimicrobiales bacterium]
MTAGIPERTAARAADAERIVRAAIAAADPGPAVTRAVLAAGELHERGVHVLAIGKAADGMMRAAIDALPHAPLSALSVVPDRTAPVSEPVPHRTVVHASRTAPPGAATKASPVVVQAAHPLPDASSAFAAARVEAQLRNAAADDIVLVLLSGGASSLCAAPVQDISIEEYAAVIRALMEAGADIAELNAVRARIDRLKGGGMARLIAPARATGFIISDVVSDRIGVIASGPLTPPATGPDEALRVLERYELWSIAPASVRHVLKSSADDFRRPRQRPRHSSRGSGETPADEYRHVETRIILNNRSALNGAAGEARRLGYDVRICDDPLTGLARTAGARVAHDAAAAAERLRPDDRPVCLVYGGETTVVVTGRGRGGRNQELTLAAAMALDGTSGITVASVGTDGIDGPTDAAGAVVDGETIRRGRQLGLHAAEALDDSDSYTFLSAARGLIRTGATGTNVMDVQVALIDPPAHS